MKGGKAMWKSLHAMLVGVAISIGSVSPGYGVEAFMYVDGIPGEEIEQKHLEWIRVLSFNSDVYHLVSAAGAGTGRVTMSPISIVKFVDKATPSLALAVFDGRNIKRVVLEMLNAPGQPPYLRIELEDVFVSSVKLEIPEEITVPRPLERVSFNFGTINWIYSQLDPSGKPIGSFKAGWDLRMNVKQ